MKAKSITETFSWRLLQGCLKRTSRLLDFWLSFVFAFLDSFLHVAAFISRLSQLPQFPGGTIFLVSRFRASVQCIRHDVHARASCKTFSRHATVSWQNSSARMSTVVRPKHMITRAALWAWQSYPVAGALTVWRADISSPKTGLDISARRSIIGQSKQIQTIWQRQQRISLLRWVHTISKRHPGHFLRRFFYKHLPHHLFPHRHLAHLVKRNSRVLNTTSGQSSEMCSNGVRWVGASHEMNMVARTWPGLQRRKKRR